MNTNKSNLVFLMHKCNIMISILYGHDHNQFIYHLSSTYKSSISLSIYIRFLCLAVLSFSDSLHRIVSLSHTLSFVDHPNFIGASLVNRNRSIFFIHSILPSSSSLQWNTNSKRSREENWKKIREFDCNT